MSTATPSSLSKNALLLVASVLFGLALAEGAIRAYFWTQGIGRSNVREILQRAKNEEPVRIDGGSGLYGLIQASEYDDIVYELKPHLEGIFKRAPIRVNSHGFRGAEVSVKKPPATLRVVGLGDSHMFGWGVGEEQTYLAVLERLLNEGSVGGMGWEVLNFGVGGYNTVMEVATLERRALAFDPDIVVIHFIGNDFLPPHFLQAPRGAALSQWYLVELVRGLMGPPIDDGVELPGEAEEEAAEATENKGPEPGSRRWFYRDFGGRKKFEQAMARLAELSREREFPVVTMMLGLGGDKREFVREVAEGHGFRLLNAAPFFWQKLEEMGFEKTRENWRHRLANGVDRHPKPAAHVAYAEALLHEIEGMDLSSVATEAP